ncbi:tetratricopeptide repeat protein [Thiocystis violacea]|uniref:tetratricopeptide repeat protein n=1 Tax=Thiocystis violacea TaxID=13725 RepID=UPI001907533A|nr:tetratricopeptide repeat protein [Thiocystis violacea]MBK1716342.1 hypothetical protein [Thiocystis violacea]
MPSLSSRLGSVGLLAGLLLQVGLASALTEPASPPPESPAGGAQSAPAAAVPVPVTGLAPDQIYAVLVGEIAGRRGDMATAFTHYLEAAELTRSERMAELAVRAAISGDDDEAAARGIRLWLAIAPDSPAAYQVAAFLRIKVEDRDGALDHLQRLVELSDEGVETAFAKAAAIIARLPSPDDRVSMMEALVDRFPESAEARQSLAMVAASSSRTDVAEQAARRALELRPEWNAPRLFLVRLLLSDGQRAEARSLLEGFVDASPDDQALRMLYGQFLVEEQEFTSARSVFERLLRNQPKAPDVLFAVGILSLQLDDLEGARLHFGRLYDTGERKDEAAFYLGQTAERAADTKSALDWYGKVDGANLDDAQVRMAFLRAKTGEVAQAREILQRLRDRSPDNAIPLFMVESEILQEIGRPDEAMSVYDTALALFPGDDTLLYARGLFAMKRDRIEQGERDLRQIIDSDPNHADALNALGYTLADRTDRHAEALVLIERAHVLKPDEPAILDSLGWVHYRLGDFEKALEYLRQAQDQLKDGEVAAHLGEVLWAMERRSEAWTVWDDAIKAYPEHEYLREVIGRYRVSRTESGVDGLAPAVPKGGDR